MALLDGISSADVLVAVLKWISQLLIVASGLSALFHELATVDAQSGRKRLTRSGRLHMLAILAGLALFGVTEVRDLGKAADKRRQAERRNLEQKKQIETLEAVRDRQQEIGESQKRQIEDGRALAAAQGLVIDNQGRQNNRLRDLLLSAYQLSAIEVSLSPIDYAFRRYDSTFRALWDEYKKAGLKVAEPSDYFQPCILHGRIEARKGERDQWLIRCLLGRPQGFTTPFFYCAPESYPWRAFEGVLDVLLSKQFLITLSDGTPLVRLSDTSRPHVVTREGRELKVTIHGPRVKLSQLVGARLQFQMESEGRELKELPSRIRLRSLDPLVRFDQSFETSWRLEKIGTKLDALQPGDDPFEVDIKIPMAGPFPLRVEVDRRFEDLPASDTVSSRAKEHH